MDFLEEMSLLNIDGPSPWEWHVLEPGKEAELVLVLFPGSIGLPRRVFQPMDGFELMGGASTESGKSRSMRLGCHLGFFQSSGMPGFEGQKRDGFCPSNG